MLRCATINRTARHAASVAGTLVINGTNVAIPATDTAANIVTAINGSVTGVTASLNASNELQLLVGDFNANPGQAPGTYAEMLSAGFTDVGAALGETGPTCCQPSDLDNPISQLTNRFDYVVERGFSSLDDALLVGNTTPFKDMRPFWPSDHAGLIATVDASSVIGAVPEPASAALVLSAIFLFGAVRLGTRI